MINDQRDVQHVVIKSSAQRPAAHKASVLAEHIAVVSVEHHDGFPFQSKFRDILEQAANVLVGVENLSIVKRDHVLHVVGIKHDVKVISCAGLGLEQVNVLVNSGI